MSYMAWEANFETGIAQVDAEHRSLVETVNRLHDAMKQGRAKAEVAGILDFLADYTGKHFAHEESLMQRHDYPGYARHKEIHDKLVAQVTGLIGTIQKGEVVLSLDLMDFLQDWLTRHILQEDQAFARHFRDRGIRF